MRHVAFVVPFVFETSLKFLAGALRLPQTAVSLISQDEVARFPQEMHGPLFAHQKVSDGLDAEQLARAVRALEQKTGRRVDRLVGVLEQLQVPLAQARALLGLPGLGVEAAVLFRDKSKMKERLRQAGVPCARSGLAGSADEARRVVTGIGYPVVIKPPAGAGAVDTFRVDRAEQLEDVLRVSPPHPQRPLLIEEFVQGVEHSFDSASIDGRMLWHSISRYAPSPLDVIQNDWIQWAVLLPRRIDGPEYATIREVAPAALEALGMGTGLAHMEWFRRADGSVAVSEVGARPPGAQFTTLLSHAHDTDMYTAWSKLVIHDVFQPPERRFAAGAAYLRGQGRGQVVAIHGLDQAQQELGDLVVEVRLPKAGQRRSSSYEGEGWVVVRHPETEVVAKALQRIVSLVRVELG